MYEPAASAIDVVLEQDRLMISWIAQKSVNVLVAGAVTAEPTDCNAGMMMQIDRPLNGQFDSKIFEIA